MTTNSKRAPLARKPHPDFPLFVHQSGRWAKKVRKKLEYFGSTRNDPNGVAALAEWLRVKDYLLAGRKRPIKAEGLTVAELCNRFLTAKDRQVEAGELTKRMRDDYFSICERIISQFGKARSVVDLDAEDFALLRAGIKGGAHHISNVVQRVRTIFKFAYDSGLIDRPIRYGNQFKKPSKRTMRLEKAEKGAKLFSAADLRRIIAAADVHMRAMIYLGLNCGFGNMDCGTIPIDAIDLDGAWVNYHRRKTGISRRCPLWPQTVRAIRKSLKRRPDHKAKADAGLLFITKYGAAWGKDTPDSPVSKEFRKLLNRLKLHRPGLGFYTLRHCFRTAADGSGDQVAANAIMGHVDDSMAATYREGIDDARLLKVTNHVRQWLVAGRKAVKRG